MRKSRFLAGLAALLSGSLLQGGCFSGFWRGMFAEGFTDNRWLDIFTDWLNEDIFG